MQRALKFGQLAVVLMLIAGCHVPVHEVARAESPDRSMVALVYQEEPRGLIETDTFVYIKPSSRKLNNHNDLVFRGGDMDGRAFGPVNVQWAGANSLIVGYCTGRTQIFVTGPTGKPILGMRLQCIYLKSRKEGGLRSFQPTGEAQLRLARENWELSAD